MADSAGEVPDGALLLNFDARLKLQFRCAAITSDAGLKAAEPWSLTSLREKLIKIGAKVVSHGRYVVFQMAEVRGAAADVRRHPHTDRTAASAASTGIISAGAQNCGS